VLGHSNINTTPASCGNIQDLKEARLMCSFEGKKEKVNLILFDYFHAKQKPSHLHVQESTCDEHNANKDRK
jgi:hypothetical protein